LLGHDEAVADWSPSPKEVDHFATFGFVVLPAFLGVERAEALKAEVDHSIRDAYESTYGERKIDGISGHYLPMASRLTPLSSSLVCDDPLLIGAAELLVGGPVIPECPEGVLFFGDAGWHNDDGIGITGVKFVTYFDPLTADNGALRFLPGSHLPEQADRVGAYFRRRRQDLRDRRHSRDATVDERVPAYVTSSKPGDVIAFDLHTWHASTGGTDRLAWTIVYQRCPDTADDRDRTQRSMADSFEQRPRGFDRERYPVWRDWVADAARHPARARLVERLHKAGVLELDGASTGW
jgi:hypothetical protein